MPDTFLYEAQHDSARMLCCYKHCTDKGYEPSYQHCHSEYEFMLVTSGSIHVVSNGDRYDFRTPCVLIHRPFSFHVIYADAGEAYERYYFYFNSAAFEGVSGCLPEFERLCPANLNVYSVRPDQLERWTKLMEELRSMDADIHNLPVLQAAIILNMVTQLTLQPTRENQVNYISRIMEYVSLHYAEPLSTDRIAAEFFISKAKLNKDFRRYTSCSIHEYLTTLRLENACERLKAGKNVTATALECGFPSISNFIRVFHKKYGIPPLQYSLRLRRGQ